jgi:hypothetical protein
MKKIIVLLILFLGLPCFSMELKTFDVRETFFKDNINSFEGKNYGDLYIKGVWSDPKGYLKSILQEELFCNLSTKECISSVTSINFLGTPQLQPYLDTYLVSYNIVDYSRGVLKLYAPTTGYIVEINLRNKTATKYKVFENGDINKYNLLLDTNKASEYLKTIIPQ